MHTLDSLTATLGNPITLWRQGNSRHANAAIARWQHKGGRIDFELCDAVQVIFNVSGGHNVELRFHNGGSIVREMSAGSVGLNYPGWPSGVTVGAPADTLQIVLSLDLIHEITGKAADPLGINLTSLRSFQAIAVQALVAFRRSPEYNRELATIARRAARLLSTEQTIPKGRTAALVPAKRQLVDDLISARLHADPCTAPTLRELADAAELSVHHFVKAFHGSAGITPHAYVNVRRIDRALTLILGEDERVSDVADAMGFASPAHFVNAFRKQLGVTPGALQAAARSV